MNYSMFQRASITNKSNTTSRLTQVYKYIFMKYLLVKLNYNSTSLSTFTNAALTFTLLSPDKFFQHWYGTDFTPNTKPAVWTLN